MANEQRSLQFGARVEFWAVYCRRRRYDGIRHVKFWERRKWKTQTGIFLGTRTLYDGTLSYEEYDYSTNTIFEPTHHFQVALVCPCSRMNPVYVPLDAIGLKEWL